MPVVSSHGDDDYARRASNAAAVLPAQAYTARASTSRCAGKPRLERRVRPPARGTKNKTKKQKRALAAQAVGRPPTARPRDAAGPGTRSADCAHFLGLTIHPPAY